MSLWRLWVIVPSVMRRWRVSSLLLESRTKDEEEEGGMGGEGRKG